MAGATQIFEYLVASVPYSVERICDAYELMGSTCLDEHHDLQLALQFWRTAVQLRNQGYLSFRVARESFLESLA